MHRSPHTAFPNTILCQLAKVTMHDSEEKAIHRLIVPLPKSKVRVPNDLDKDEEEAATAAAAAGDSIEDINDADTDTLDLPIAL